MLDGAKTIALKEGIVTFGEKLKLQHVLFVPKLKSNLKITSQILDDSNFVIHFTNKIYTIQDCSLRMYIGIGEQGKGLYFLKRVTFICVYMIIGIASSELWHKRMGHYSSRITYLTSKVGSASRSDSVKNKF